ncbi:HET-domain-containing protein [Durotheca rogersii]|uniref:HET-domain-containing protein n=1 Tax=Durotheca rogersii TaxID=419775 RepID=UPI002220E435|nr:HET-domain-containing protein [Durotheca rogersii]KAI5862493.1 HET-domain-containing protein [Durotheca rogersii]
MRLIDVHSRKLKEFFNTKPPEYAILSHTWGSEEVILQDLDTTAYMKKLGWAKIDMCCQTAEKEGLDWAWVDTCCIDKRDSAELSEAINSMFSWYRISRVCYVYLADVTKDEDHSRENSTFRKSRWFNRGWTLQELLAPTRMKFYDKNWDFIAERKDLLDAISQTTGISLAAVQTPLSYIPSASIAERLSWAAKRETTRIEDRAYSLLGICEIKMPLIYGEGDRAFFRLQQEIIRTMYDQTVFWWSLGNGWTQWFCDGHSGTARTLSEVGGLKVLADSPDAFRGFKSRYVSTRLGKHYMMTHSGLHIELPVISLGDSQRSFYLAIFSAMDILKSAPLHIGMPVQDCEVLLPGQAPSVVKFFEKAMGNSPFPLPFPLPAGITEIPLYISVPPDHIQSSRLSSRLAECSRHIQLIFGLLYSLDYILWDYYPPAVEINDGFLTAHLGADELMLLRFHNPDQNGSILVMTYPVEDGQASWAVATYTDDNSSAWEFLLRPNFRKFDFLSLRNSPSLNWSTTISVPLEDSLPLVVGLQVTDDSIKITSSIGDTVKECAEEKQEVVRCRNVKIEGDKGLCNMG